MKMKDVKDKYAIWTPQDPYWEMYDSLEDAVDSQNGRETNVYLIRPQLLGRFKRKTTIVQVGKLKAKKQH